MPPKRKDSDELPSGRDRKKQKMADARTIPVQPTQPGTSFTNAVAGPSRLTGPELPSAIDVERFAEARAFEINAMQTAIKTASSASTTRAWQLLPASLRRRAASHDVRRVPLRLRDKARAEMDPVQKKLNKHRIPKKGKDKRLGRTESFAKRQRDKTWLETHLWHAKRMHMENMWGYRLAVSPTMKSFRPSHRASIQGSIIHDASYQAIVELRGTAEMLSQIISLCCDPNGPSINASRFTGGARVYPTDLYRPDRYPFDLVAPATVLWRPASKDVNEQRAIWVKFHPAVFDHVWDALESAASTVSSRLKSVPGKKVHDVDLIDLRGEMNMFEIMGPKANQVLKGVLSPTKDKRSEFKDFWRSLTDMQTTAQLVRGMVIGFTVNDPRLDFPPKNAKPRTDAEGYSVAPPITFPTSVLAESDIWSEARRKEIKTPKFKKAELDERRSKNLVPGTPLNPGRNDDHIPVLLIQRSLETSSESRGIHGWTLVVPAGWGMPFFSSLVYTGTLVGGQRERQTQFFEAGTPFFPRDYPSTPLYDREEAARAKQEQEHWQRRPPSKRPNYEKLGTRSPWKPDWTVVLGLESDLTSTQREDAMDEDRSCGSWLLRHRALLEGVLAASDPPAALMAEMTALRAKRSLSALSLTPVDLWATALVNVQIQFILRGSPSDLAVIYSIQDEEAKQWQTLFDQKKSRLHDPLEESELEMQLSQLKGPQESIIGYVSAGNFSLMRGEGFALGAVPVRRLHELRQQAQRLHPNNTAFPLLAKVRNRDGLVCRPVYLKIV